MTIYSNAPQHPKALISEIDQDLRVKLAQWNNDTSKKNLIIQGATGRGKSYAASALLNFWGSRRCVEAFPERTYGFVHCGELYQTWLANQTEPRKNEELRLKLIKTDYLVFDDLGLRTPSDAFLDFFHCVIEQRSWSDKTRNVFTTNLSSKEIHEMFSARILSRIGSESVITIEGSDRRRSCLLKKVD